MRAHVVSIVWHNKEPVFGVDVVGTDCGVLVATGGADRVLRLWRFCDDTPGPTTPGTSSSSTGSGSARPAGVTYLCGYARHNGAVNAVRFAPVPAPPLTASASAEGDSASSSSSGTTTTGPATTTNEGNGLPLLATASDDGYAIVWRCTGAPEGGAGARLGADADAEDSSDGARVAALGGADRALRARAGGWRQWKLVRAPSDVYDLCWSADGRHLAGATTENAVFVAALATGAVRVVREHAHFVQGVAWDPRGRLLVSESSDQTLRVYATPRAGAARPLLRHVVRRLHAPGATPCESDVEGGGDDDSGSDDDHDGDGPKSDGNNNSSSSSNNARPSTTTTTTTTPSGQPLFRSEAAHTFFRRLSWSPDGSLLVAPAGMFVPPEAAGAGGAARAAHVVNTAYVFARGMLRQPFLHLPGHRSVVVAARFSPILYQLRESAPPGAASEATPAPAVPLPYRMVFAVASLDAVVVYDTQAWHAVAAARRLHLAAITDLAWTPDGRHVLVASRDGFCSVLSFAPGELGTPLPADAPLSPAMAAVARARSGTFSDEPVSSPARRRPKPAPATAPTPAPAPIVPAPVVPAPAAEQPKRKRIRPILIPPSQDGCT